MTYLVFSQILQGVSTFLTVVYCLVFLYCIMGLFLRSASPIYQFICRAVDPLLRPFRPLARKLILRGLRFDVSPFLTILAILLLQRLVLWGAFWLRLR